MITTPTDTIPLVLKRAMRERNLNQRELAGFLEISQSRLSETLSGIRPVNLDLARRLYTKLGVSATALLTYLTDPR